MRSGAYAGSDAAGAGSHIRFVALLPQLTPATDLGRHWTETYAARAGSSVQQFLEGRFGGALSVDQIGKAIADLTSDDSYDSPTYLLTPVELQPLD